jgi:hypothetical protein
MIRINAERYHLTAATGTTVRPILDKINISAFFTAAYVHNFPLAQTIDYHRKSGTSRKSYSAFGDQYGIFVLGFRLEFYDAF